MSEDQKRKYRRVQRWFHANRDKRVKYNARYYSKNAECFRQLARQARAANPDRSRQHSQQYRDRNPNYMREYFARKKLRLAWFKWSFQCAQSRQSTGELHG